MLINLTELSKYAKDNYGVNIEFRLDLRPHIMSLEVVVDNANRVEVNVYTLDSLALSMLGPNWIKEEIDRICDDFTRHNSG